MSVLIRGMEMPKTCWFCGFEKMNPYGDLFCKVLQRNVEVVEFCVRPSDCPLTEVPDKHGELIERKAVIDICGEKQGTANLIGEMRGISKVWKAVKKLPTIIEAEGS